MSELQETYNSVSETEHLATELAQHSIITEERHDEILEETERVCQRLEQLSAENSTRNQNLETALAAELKALASELKAIRAELESLKQSQVTRPTVPNTPSSEPISPSVEVDHLAPKIEDPLPPSPAPPSESEPPAAPKKRRKI